MKTLEELQNLCLGCMNPLQQPQKPCPVCGWQSGMSNKDYQLVPGSVLAGRYLVGKVLGEGGFGMTYIGWSIVGDKKVAVKEFFPDNKMIARADDNYTVIPSNKVQESFEEGKQRFFKESQTLAMFESDPNIVNVEDFFSENNTAYIIMEFLDGQTFMKYLETIGRPLTLEQTLNILEPVIGALERIHAKNLLHRDISPDNIMLTGTTTKLLDFGSARPFSLDGKQKNTVYVKLGYAPQEQFFMNGKQGSWTDEHALAATIYHAVTGSAPPSVTQRVDRNGADTLQPPNSVGASLTPEQEFALLKGMAIDYKQRYPTLREFSAALSGKREGLMEKLFGSLKNFWRGLRGN